MVAEGTSHTTKHPALVEEGEVVLEHSTLETYAAAVDPNEDHLDEDSVWLREQRISHKSIHWFQRPSVIMVGLALFIFAFGTASAEASRQMIQFKLACNSVTEESRAGFCDPASTQVLVSSLQQGYSIAQGIATIIASGKVAPLSDQHGRKMFILLLVFAQLIGRFLRYAVMSHYNALQFKLMVCTEILSNCFGGVFTLLTLCSCYVSDIAEPSQRTHFLGIVMACLFVGLSLGPLVGNYILSLTASPQSSSVPDASHAPNISSGEFAPLRFELGILSILLLFIAFILPESRGETARRKSRSLSSSSSFSSLRPPVKPSRMDSFSSIFNFLRPLRLILYPKDSVHRSRHAMIGKHRMAVFILIMTECTVSSLAVAVGEIDLLYGIYRFNWTAQNLGVLMVATCLIRAFSLMVISPLMSRKLFQQYFGFALNKRRFDKIDYGLISVAYCCATTGQIVLGLSRSGSVFLLGSMISAFASFASPALTSSVVKYFPESMTGEVFGSMAIVRNILSITTPLILLGFYKTSLSKWNMPQLTFFLLASLFAFITSLVTLVIVRSEMDDDEAPDGACTPIS